MRIISFDVGIKNLACCVLDVKSSIDFEILFWDVLNLTNPTIYPPCSNDSCNHKVKHMFHKAVKKASPHRANMLPNRKTNICLS